MFKDQIKVQLQEKFAGALKKISPRGLELIVDQINSTVTTEDEIKDKIDGLDNAPIPFTKYVELLESETDRRVRQAKDTIKKDYDLVPKKAAEETKPDGQQSKPAAEGAQPDLATIVQQQLQALLQPFQQQLGNISEQTTRLKLKEAFKNKGIPESWADDVQITAELNMDEALTKAETRWNEANQIAINKAVDQGQVLRGNQHAPGQLLQKIQEFGKQADLKAEGYNIKTDI